MPNKDLTFTPKVYANENILFLNEYRQAFRNGSLTLDTSYTQGYKNTSSTKTSGSRNHIFGNIDLNFDSEKPFESNLSAKFQRTSNNTYFRIHDINTSLVSSENTNLDLNENLTQSNEISSGLEKNIAPSNGDLSNIEEQDPSDILENDDNNQTRCMTNTAKKILVVSLK